MWTTSFHCQSIDQLKTTLRNSTEHQTPSLGIVFCSPNYDVDEIRTAFSELGIDLVGCTTAGEIVDTALYENSIAVLLLDLDPAYYHIGTKQHQGKDVYQAALALGQEAVTKFEHPAMIIFSGGLVVIAGGGARYRSARRRRDASHGTCTARWAFGLTCCCSDGRLPAFISPFLNPLSGSLTASTPIPTISSDPARAFCSH